LKFLITPGNELVTATNDGGFAVRYYDKEWRTNTKWPHIISTEVTPYVVIITDE